MRFKAGNGEAFERPNYSEVLFAYYISRKDYRSAAASMYRYAAKVHLAENEGRSAKRSQHLAEICQSLSSTIEALSMLAGDDAWFVAEPIGAAVVSSNFGDRSAVMPDGLPQPSKKRKLESENTMWYKGRETVSLDDVRNSFALASAKLLLGSQNPSYGTSSESCA